MRRIPFFVSKHILTMVLLAVSLVGCESENQELPKGFQIHPDFELTLAASEPLVFDPVDMDFDENGRTFILEMPGYPNGDAHSRLVELVDMNGDSTFDERRVMDDSLGVATSFMPYKKGFLVASPPYLLWILDTDGDGKIDQRKKLMGGFNNKNLQHNFNGLTYGIDNWIYGANGGNSGRPFFENDTTSFLELRNADFKLDLENGKIERVGRSSGGFEITFDEWGHLFETHNMIHVSQLVFENRYLSDLPVLPTHALSNISDHEEKGTSRIYPIGEQETRVNHPEQAGYFSGACGITHYGGGAFHDLNGSLLVADCVLNLIHVDALTQNGSAFRASRIDQNKEFLASTDRSFRPVNMAVAPDGALYVLDIHRDVIEHPEWIPDDMEAKMDLDAGKDQGRIYRITPKENWSPTTFDIHISDSKNLTAALNSSNQWARNTAQRLLVTENRKEAVPDLKKLFGTSNNALARLHALWTLDGLDALETPLLIKAFSDAATGVRENAIKMAEKRVNTDRNIAHELISLLQDPSPVVRMQACLALGTLNPENYDLVRDDLAKGLTHQLASTNNDAWAVRAMASALQQQDLRFSQHLLLQNVTGLTKPHLDLLSILAEKIGRDRTAKAIISYLETLKQSEVKASIAPILVEALASGRKKGLDREFDQGTVDKLSKVLRAIESKNDMVLIRATGSLRKSFGLPMSPKFKNLLHTARKTVLRTELSTEERLEQLRLIGQDDFKNNEELLFKLLDNTQPLALQQAALEQLKEANDKKVGDRLLQLWPNLGPMARREATDILLYQAHNHDALLSAMENNEVSLGEFNLDLERRRTLLFWSDEAIQKRARALFSDSGVVKRSEAIEKMRPALALKGQVSEGKKVFEAQCAQCHRYGDIGKDVGPVLTEVNRKSKESLLYDILDPNAAVDTEYLNHRVKTKEGSVVTGLVFHETDTEIGIKMMGGSEKIILKSEIAAFASMGTSLMFEGLEANMSQQEMADLLAFLQQ